MRSRNSRLQAGMLLSYTCAEDENRNTGMLFLFEGASDIKTLGELNKAIEAITKDAKGFRWRTLVDLASLEQIAPEVPASKVHKLETAEFAMLTKSELVSLLGPSIERVLAGKEPLFPRAGAASGGIAKGIDFLNQEKSITYLLEQLRAGNSVLLYAPRRSGKSSLLNKIVEVVHQDGGFAAYVDAQMDKTKESFSIRVLAKVKGQGVGLTRRQLADNMPSWDKIFEQALAEIPQTSPHASVLLIDELAYFCESIADRTQTTDFLKVMAESCNRANIRLVIAGSESLDEFLINKYDIDLKSIAGGWNSFVDYWLPPLGSESLDIELRRLLIGTGLVASDDDLHWLEKNIDLQVPFAARVFLDLLSSTVSEHGELDIEDLNRALEQYLEETSDFKDMERHIEQLAARAPGGPAIYQVITDLCKADLDGDGAQATEVAARLGDGDIQEGMPALSDLKNIVPIVQSTDKLHLPARLFRAWWLHREGQQT